MDQAPPTEAIQHRRQELLARPTLEGVLLEHVPQQAVPAGRIVAPEHLTDCCVDFIEGSAVARIEGGVCVDHEVFANAQHRRQVLQPCDMPGTQTVEIAQ